jgi:uncharacterized protein (DUF2132 family)
MVADAVVVTTVVAEPVHAVIVEQVVDVLVDTVWEDWSGNRDVTTMYFVVQVGKRLLAVQETVVADLVVVTMVEAEPVHAVTVAQVVEVLVETAWEDWSG